MFGVCRTDRCADRIQTAIADRIQTELHHADGKEAALADRPNCICSDPYAVRGKIVSK